MFHFKMRYSSDKTGVFFHFLKYILFHFLFAVIAMEALARSFDTPPPDWSGDPCLPRQNSWTGVTCSEGKFARVVSL